MTEIICIQTKVPAHGNVGETKLQLFTLFSGNPCHKPHLMDRFNFGKSSNNSFHT